MESTGLTGLSVLIVEDDVLLRKQIASLLERMGVDVTAVSTTAEARNLASGLAVDFVLLDVHLPDGSGLDLLRRKVFVGVQGVIVMTADAGVTGAVEAMQLGAMDYLSKPFELGEIPLVIQRVRRRRQGARLDEHRQADQASSAPSFFFGASLSDLEKTLAKIIEADRRLRRHLPPVLIQGETGTGKTTMARWLHERGPRAERPMVEMNCSALPETLAESELFGHERGAFTDAKSARMGLFEAADGGTLFLDELPSLSLPLQAKVLKVLEDHRLRRVGGRREIPVDVRVIAATSCDLKVEVTHGRFREDLLHRLDLFRVNLPPLRERGDDVTELAERYLDHLGRRHRLPGRTLSEGARRRIRSHAWPGNVRELAHELERALVFEETEVLELRQLPGGTTDMADETTLAGGWFNPAFTFPEEGFDLEASIQFLIQRALRQTEGNVSAAARLLGVSRDYVRYRLAGQKRQPESGN